MITETVPHICGAGHTWTAEMYFELGGWFYVNEAAADCPTCGAEALPE